MTTAADQIGYYGEEDILLAFRDSTHSLAVGAFEFPIQFQQREVARENYESQGTRTERESTCLIRTADALTGQLERDLIVKIKSPAQPAGVNYDIRAIYRIQDGAITRVVLAEADAIEDTEMDGGTN